MGMRLGAYCVCASVSVPANVNGLGKQVVSVICKLAIQKVFFLKEIWIKSDISIAKARTMSLYLESQNVLISGKAAGSSLRSTA